MITEYDLSQIDAIRPFLGACLDNISQLNSTLSVTMEVSGVIPDLLSAVISSEKETIDNRNNYDVLLKNTI